MANELFDDFIAFGRRVMQGVDRGEEESIRFKRLLGEITGLLMDTHTMVMRRLEKLERAADEHEAQFVLEELRAEPLEAAFRAEGLCDAFSALGDALSRVYWRTRDDEEVPFTDGEMEAVQSMASTLIEREGQVAMGYTEEIERLLQSLYRDSAPENMDRLREAAAAARKKLTDQTADFEVLANRFRRLEER